MPKLLKFFKDTGCAISGSFIVQVMLAEKYEGSDIDIVMPLSMGEEMKKLSEDLGSALVIPKTSDYGGEIQMDDMLDDAPPGDPSEYINSGKIVHDVYYMSYKGRSINFITTQVSIAKHIDSYDLNIVRNSYTPTNLFIEDLAGILSKQIVVCNPTNNYIKRCKKYVERGFKLKKQDPDLELTLLNLLLDQERFNRGQIRAKFVCGSDYERCQFLDGETAYDCTQFPDDHGFDCPIRWLCKSYKHVHMVKGGLCADAMVDKPYEYCSEIIVLGSHLH